MMAGVDGRALRLVLAVAMVAVASSLLLAGVGASEPVNAESADHGSAERIISLSPPLTQTVVALGAAELLVGLSDYCPLEEPLDPAIDRVGTSLTPSWEQLVRLRPDRILSERVQGASSTPLTAVAATTVLPWMTVSDMTRGVQILGELTGRQEEAERLRVRLMTGLARDVKADAPRVLMILGASAPGDGPLFFVQDASLHGAALGAAGFRNAMEGPVSGSPSLSVEGLLEADPDGILLLVADPEWSQDKQDQLLKRFARVPGLKAVSSMSIGVVDGPRVFNTGPSILELVRQIRREARRVGLKPGGSL